VEFIPWKLHH